ncbi:type II secretion system protein [Ideonella livida]|uniref:Type II secretion system protein n=1 Tax=Ideonella livida TaxID=2707176 RepID=A0A7C9PEU0_9BURK|nr:type II secretion system protein [Ideonella livida]NDY89868.1 type II secretion system protein [Ideonella livida]
MRPTPRSELAARPQRGFTLLEAVMVIVLTGIVASLAGQFIVAPVQAYLALSARARLGDMADTALRGMGRELRAALPNSVRVSADGRTVEFIPTTAGARYKSQGLGALLDGVLTPTFSVLGPGLNLSSANQQLVFRNLGAAVPGQDAYAPNGTLLEQLSSNRRQALNLAGLTSTLSLLSLAPLPTGTISPPYRVFAVLQPVSFHCDLATGRLTRHSAYGFQASQPVPPAGTAHVLAEGVTACAFSLDPGLQGNALVQLRLTLGASGALSGQESLSLHHALHVDNLP